MLTKRSFQHKMVLNTVCNNKGDSQGRLHGKRVSEQKTFVHQVFKTQFRIKKGHSQHRLYVKRIF